MLPFTTLVFFKAMRAAYKNIEIFWKNLSFDLKTRPQASLWFKICPQNSIHISHSHINNFRYIISPQP